jgi:hypothetical protein
MQQSFFCKFVRRVKVWESSNFLMIFYMEQNVFTNEDLLQAACFQWSWNFKPETRRCIWHIPNGKKRTIAEACMLQAMGVIAGVHDLHFYWRSRLYILELKVGTNTLSPAQRKWKEAMEAQGAMFFEIRTLNSFKNAVNAILHGCEANYHPTHNPRA